jgi:anti-sigma-K factor RskA
VNLLAPDRLEALARAYALGTLQGLARRRFERLLQESEAARRATAQWHERFATLAAALPPIEPSETVWRGLEQRLGLASTIAPTIARPTAAAREPSWWQRWFGARGLAGALVGAIAGVVLTTALLQTNPGWIGHEPVRDTLPPSYVGLLSDKDGRPAVLLSSRRHGRVLTAKMLQPLAPPPGQAAFLWAFPKDGGAPFLVGRLPASGTASLALPDTSEKLFFVVDRLGVTFDADTTTPAAPAGALVVSGPCVKLW